MFFIFLFLQKMEKPQKFSQVIKASKLKDQIKALKKELTNAQNLLTAMDRELAKLKSQLAESKLGFRAKLFRRQTKDRNPIF